MTLMQATPGLEIQTCISAKWMVLLAKLFIMILQSSLRKNSCGEKLNFGQGKKLISCNGSHDTVLLAHPAAEPPGLARAQLPRVQGCPEASMLIVSLKSGAQWQLQDMIRVLSY